jgi:NADH-quinone oxidoreductase subunit L
MTSFYMFRLWYMTFFGELRADQVIDAEEEPSGGVHAPSSAHAAQGDTHHAPHAAHVGHDDHGHGHGHHPHESPMIMIAPLVVLAILSAIGGFVGMGNRFEKFLAPTFAQYAVQQHGEAAADTRSETPEAEQHAAASPASPAEPRHEPEENRGLEVTLMGVSILLAFGGWGLAYYFYGKDLERPKRVARSIHGVYNTLWNKYWIDELYSKVFIQPIMRGSTNVLWRGVDVDLIDGVVNGAGHTASGVSGVTRRMQSGLIRSYAAWVAIGAAGIVAYMIYVGVNR